MLERRPMPLPSLLTLLSVVTIVLLALPSRTIAADDPGRFDMPLPKSAAEWDKGRAELRAKLWSLLGDLPPPFVPEATIVKREQRRGYTLESFTFDNRAGATVYGYVLVPDVKAGEAADIRRPAILYNHFHGGQYKLGKEE